MQQRALVTWKPAGFLSHDPQPPGGDVVRSGERHAFLRFSWEGPRPLRFEVWLDDGSLRRLPAAPIANLQETWWYRVEVEARRPALSYVVRLELAGGAGAPDGRWPRGAGQAAPAGTATVWWGPRGSSAAMPGPGEWWAVDLAQRPAFVTPAWARTGVAYQIFPDRFYNGDPANDPPGVAAWGDAPTFSNFFGGDLEGIRRRLDYLQHLGVDVIYLNPIVQAPSNHRYDASDYLAVDPALGTEETVRRLIDEMHRRGMRLILDAVFNHTGETFWAFRDVAEKGPASPYFHWYYVYEWPLRRDPPSYACWWNLPHLPKLNTAHPEVRAYLFRVTRYWMELGADGWRLDVPNELEPGFWPEWRKLVKSLKPDAYIVGEIWHEASGYLSGEQFDAVMNYPLRDALLDFFVRRSIGPVELWQRLGHLARAYPAPAFLTLMNVLGSHDTERVRTAAGGSSQAVRAMMLFVAAFPGLPTVYYGDEAGMTGGKDPDCRQCFPWDERRQDLPTWRWVRRLARLRKQVGALARGDLAVVEVAGSSDVVAFGRLRGGPPAGAALCVVSRSQGRETVTVDPGEEMADLAEVGRARHARGRATRWVDLLSGRCVSGGRRLRLTLGPQSGMLLVPHSTWGALCR
ncbi:glycoside hydrolase family 13 protein [Carboxydochorda subterranea]|uniref:Glycoside hydrolase family 13 protein n=1 Tax=Carboxydichorda subterranea TaxID=3109565 RepID=A0ABZ1BUP8_9FIRM|nr:glycoside hydrolase family 13 protein [Limnochorda sp. L945t]WRP16386.1 glycoside hydrolase family 13 protein [Limnochorda sp. L945t]